MRALERRLGLLAVVAISMSAMMGSGIFVLPGLAALKTGPSVWLAYILAAVCVLPAAIAKSELATAMPFSGGSYVYLDRAFGPLPGTVFGIGLWGSLLLKSAFALIGFSAYLGYLVDVPISAAGMVLLVLITLLNISGAKAVKRFQVPVFFLSLLGLGALIVVAVPKIDLGHFDPSFTHDESGFLGACAFVFIAYAGVTKIAAIAEEVKDPGRNIPRGILLSLLFITIIYGTLVFALMGTVPLEELTSEAQQAAPAPIYLMAKVVAGPDAATAMAVLAIITMVAMANAGLMASSRFPFAMSRAQLLPSAFQKVSERFVTPVNAILITSVFMGIAIMFLDVVKIAKLASAFMIIVFVALNIAVIVLRANAPMWYKPTFKSPYYPWLQVFGVISGVALLLMMGGVVLMAMLFIVGLGVGAYYAYGRRRVNRRGVMARLGRRSDLVTEQLEIDDVLPNSAPVMVPLFGCERAPEMLVEMAASLAHGRKVEVIHVTEVPEQTNLGALLEEDAIIDGLKRRITALKEQSIDVEFDAVVSRDAAKTLYRSAQRVTCDWLVMEWRDTHLHDVGKYRPQDWLLHHMPCNIATFKDAGVRYMREILVTASPTPHEDLVVSTADHLAGTYGASLTFIRHIPDGLSDDQIVAQKAYVEELRSGCRSPSRSLFVSGKSAIDAIAKESPRFDLIVTSAPYRWKGIWERLGLKTTKADRLTRVVACSVLRLS